MHEAYTATHIVTLNTQHQTIESIAAYGKNVFVGTRQGHLLIYNIYNDFGKEATQLLCYNKTFNKKPVVQIAVVPFLDILISLCGTSSDGLMTIHDISNINLQRVIQTLDETKGASKFCIDVQEHQSFTGGVKITVMLCVVVKKRLKTYYWKNRSFIKHADINVKETPLSLAYSKDSLVLGFKMNDYMTVNLLTDEEIEHFPIGRNSEPSVIRVTDTTVGLGKDGQTIVLEAAGASEFSGVKAISWDAMPVNIVYDEPFFIGLLQDGLQIRTLDPSLLVQNLSTVPAAKFITRVKSGLMYVATSSQIWSVQTASRVKQVSVLLEQRQFQLALQLVNISEDSEEDKTRNIEQIKKLFAHDLFSKKKFREALKTFSELRTDSCEVIRLFPNMLPPSTPLSNLSSPPPLSSLSPSDMEEAIPSLVEYLREVRLRMFEDLGSVKSDQARQLFMIIDTTLLKCYLQTNDALVSPLLRLNNCHLEESEKTLLEYEKYPELIILYQTNDLHSKALDLLQAQSKYADSPLFGPERTIQYLQQLGEEHMDVILKFSSWVLDQNPEEGLRIFTEDVCEVEQLPRARVLDFLRRKFKHLVIPYLEHIVNVWVDTTPLFHNTLIHEYRAKITSGANVGPDVSSPSSEGSNINPGANSTSPGANSTSLGANSTGPGANSTSPGANSTCPGANSTGRGANLTTTRAKLLKLLRTSDHYSLENVIVQFPYDSLFEERAIVLGKLEKHEQVLGIYVNVLGDIQKAIAYCEQVYNSQSKDKDKVHILLLKLLISAPDNWMGGIASPEPVQPDLETALNLLEENATKIAAPLALPILPDNVPLARVLHYLRATLCKSLNDKRKAQVMRGLLYSEHLQSQEQRIHYESQHVFITENNICPVCKKRFGNQSAFVRYPSGDIVHYSCQEKYSYSVSAPSIPE